MKIIVDKEFKHDGKKYEAGETVELPDQLAQDIIDKGFAKNAEEIEKNLEVKTADEIESEEEDVPDAGTFVADEGGEKEAGASPRGPQQQRGPHRTQPSQPSKPGEESVWKDIERELDAEPSKAPKWEPSEPGDQLLGEVVRTGKGPNGRLLEVETREGENYILWERVALKDLFDRANAGDKIGVRFLGKEESQSGRSYYNFRTAIRK